MCYGFLGSHINYRVQCIQRNGIVIIKEIWQHTYFPVKTEHPGLPQQSSGQESVYQCRGQGFNPWSGKIPHAEGPLSKLLTPCAASTEAHALRTCAMRVHGLQQEKPLQGVAPACSNQKSPRAAVKILHSPAPQRASKILRMIKISAVTQKLGAYYMLF